MKYALVLNDMRSPNIENVQVVRVDDGPTPLRDFYEGELVEPYHDGPWRKTFRDGGPLEWFNPVTNLAVENNYWGGIWTVRDGTAVGDSELKALP